MSEAADVIFASLKQASQSGAPLYLQLRRSIEDAVNRGLIGPGDIAVFTSMCMCWSGYLSTHASMMDSLHCKDLIGKAIISHTIGGLCAGMAAHWFFLLLT